MRSSGRRKTKKTRLIYSEGAHDKAFLDCLKLIYSTDKYNVDIKRGKGGSQPYMTEEAFKRGRAYDQTYLKIDGDRPAEEMETANSIASVAGVQIIRTVPCIEALLIKILEPEKRIASWSSDKLKKYFEDNYIGTKKRGDVRAYQKIFTKEILDSARQSQPELGLIIELF